MPLVTLNNIRLHYLDTGVPAGSAADALPMVLLHGLGCSSHDWDYQMPVFSREYRVIAPCLRGFGESDKPLGPYSVAGFARDLRALLSHLGIKRCHLLGYSLGGAVALQAAVDFPEAIASLVVVNSQPSFEVRHWREHLMKIYRIGLGSDKGMERMTRLLARHCFPRPNQRELRDEMMRRHRRNHRAPYLAAIQALAGWSVMPRVSELAAPVLMLSAAQDYVPVSERAALARRMPATRFQVIEDSRHATPVDQPQAMNSAVLDFLRSVELRPSLARADAPLHHMRSSGIG
jgi:3-oxoadipate enol-lactonase